jgi:hypothetical protein
MQRDRRTGCVPTGFQGFGAEPATVPGHPFGLNLSANDRPLLAFLKTPGTVTRVGPRGSCGRRETPNNGERSPVAGPGAWRGDRSGGSGLGRHSPGIWDREGNLVIEDRNAAGWNCQEERCMDVHCVEMVAGEVNDTDGWERLACAFTALARFRVAITGAIAG